MSPSGWEARATHEKCANNQPYGDAAGLKGWGGSNQWEQRSLGKAGQGLVGLPGFQSGWTDRSIQPQGHWCGMARAFLFELTNAWTFGWSSCGPAGPSSYSRISAPCKANFTFLLGFADCHHHVLAPVWVLVFHGDESRVADLSCRPHEGFLQHLWSNPPAAGPPHSKPHLYSQWQAD